MQFGIRSPMMKRSQSWSFWLVVINKNCRTGLSVGVFTDLIFFKFCLKKKQKFTTRKRAHKERKRKRVWGVSSLNSCSFPLSHTHTGECVGIVMGDPFFFYLKRKNKKKRGYNVVFLLLWLVNFWQSWATPFSTRRLVTGPALKALRLT